MCHCVLVFCAVSNNSFVTDNADPPGDLPSPNFQPEQSRQGDSDDALTEILSAEDVRAGLARNEASAPVLSGTAPPQTRVYEHWQIPPNEEGFPGPGYFVEPHQGSVHAGYPPALGDLDHLRLRRKSVPAKQGLRGVLNNVARVNLPPGPDETYEMALRQRVQRMVRTTFPITVLAVKGGVGKTVVTEVLGSTFSAVRGDRVIAVDLDPDAGNLISRHGRESGLSIADLTADGSSTRYLDVRAHTSQNQATRLEVLTGPDFVHSPKPLQESEVYAVMPILGEHYSVVLMDTGTGFKTALMGAVLRQSRTLVLVSSASIDSLEETQLTLEWLKHNGYQDLLDTAVLVINNVHSGRPNVDLARVVKQFAYRIAPERIFVLPFDEHIFEGRQIILELLSAKTRRRYLEMAARISELFPLVD
jgi:MinD-like ATPase involved in chromosome partitioning or flagellar assembly